jgi:hypothetical protein
MKHIFAFILFIAFSAQVNTQNVITRRVTNAKNEPVVSAGISRKQTVVGIYSALYSGAPYFPLVGWHWFSKVGEK